MKSITMTWEGSSDPAMPFLATGLVAEWLNFNLLDPESNPLSGPRASEHAPGYLITATPKGDEVHFHVKAPVNADD